MQSPNLLLTTQDHKGFSIVLLSVVTASSHPGHGKQVTASLTRVPQRLHLYRLVAPWASWNYKTRVKSNFLGPQKGNAGQKWTLPTCLIPCIIWQIFSGHLLCARLCAETTGDMEMSPGRSRSQTLSGGGKESRAYRSPGVLDFQPFLIYKLPPPPDAGLCTHL